MPVLDQVEPMTAFFLVSGLLFLVEQVVFYSWPGSIIYKAGIPVRRLRVPFSDLKYWRAVSVDTVFMRSRIDTKRGALYVRNRHYLLTWSPILFVDEMRFDEPEVLTVRVGPVTGVLIILLIVPGVLSALKAGFQGVFFAVLVGLPLTWMYRRFTWMVRRYWPS